MLLVSLAFLHVTLTHIILSNIIMSISHGSARNTIRFRTCKSIQSNDCTPSNDWSPTFRDYRTTKRVGKSGLPLKRHGEELLSTESLTLPKASMARAGLVQSQKILSDPLHSIGPDHLVFNWGEGRQGQGQRCYVCFHSQKSFARHKEKTPVTSPFMTNVK